MVEGDQGHFSILIITTLPQALDIFQVVDVPHKTYCPELGKGSRQTQTRTCLEEVSLPET